MQTWIQDLPGELPDVLCPIALAHTARTRLFGGEASQVANIDSTDR